MTDPDPDEAGDRLAGLTSWHADWPGLRVVVLGLGVTGFSVADTLVELGCEVLVIADHATPERIRLLDVIGGMLVMDSDDHTGASALDDFGADLVVVSPGYHPNHPLLVSADERGVPIWGDIELAWRVRDKVLRDETGSPAEWICVTGTNGKTTTVGLTVAMLRADGRRAAACGNIGVPVLDVVRDPSGFDVLVVELSSYQLHWMTDGAGRVAPWASVCLNLADDHLDWHGSADAYAGAKAKVYDNTKVACVYNLADPATRRMVEGADVIDGARAIGFGLGVPGLSDFGVVDGILCDRAFLDDRRNTALELTTVTELAQAGLAAPHVVANVLAASALARSLGVPPLVIRDALSAFALDPHRIEFVAEQDGVRWIDDSKATNPHAASASLGAFDSIVWVVGGLLKGVDIGEIVAERRGRLRAAIVIGVDRAPVIEAFARHAPDVPLLEVDAGKTEAIMPTVARLAAGVARTGDVVLLAPAAASMDQFSDYGDRGTRFADAVRQMLGGSANDPHPSSAA